MPLYFRVRQSRIRQKKRSEKYSLGVLMISMSLSHCTLYSSSFASSIVPKLPSARSLSIFILIITTIAELS